MRLTAINTSGPRRQGWGLLNRSSPFVNIIPFNINESLISSNISYAHLAGVPAAKHECYLSDLANTYTTSTRSQLETYYSDVIMSAITFQVNGVSMVFFPCSGTGQRKHQSFALLAFVRGIHRWLVNCPQKGKRASNAENVSIWWRLHVTNGIFTTTVAGQFTLWNLADFSCTDGFERCCPTTNTYLHNPIDSPLYLLNVFH